MKQIKCENCGAPMKYGRIAICEYCGSQYELYGGPEIPERQPARMYACNSFSTFATSYDLNSGSFYVVG
jgi:hypothetical protein